MDAPSLLSRLTGLIAVLVFPANVFAQPGTPAVSDEFTVLVYNVENLFDLDGEAVYDQYEQDPRENRFPYTPQHLLSKLQATRLVLQQFNDGRGPEIVLIQELERDRTARSTVPNYRTFLNFYRSTTIEAMLTTGFNDRIAGLPVEALLLKALDDVGMGDYEIALPPFPDDPDSKPPHTNAVFTRFPVIDVRAFANESARDHLEVTLDVHGHAVTLINNHWKSGASSPRTEPTRISNAQVLRDRVDEILAANPTTDLILAGDFNSHYQQDLILADMPTTGLVGVLRSQGNERALLRDGGPDLYNLWYELPHAERGSEAYRAEWGTLMQIILTQGLYDHHGVQYVDNSFFVARLPGLNIDPHFGTPIRWFYTGGGGGFNDHFPVGARFRVLGSGDTDRFIALENPGRENPDLDVAPPQVDYASFDANQALNPALLRGVDDRMLAQHFGRVFLLQTEVHDDPLHVHVAGRGFSLWSPDFTVRDALEERDGETVRFLGQLGEHRGQIQFVVHDAEWLLD